MRQSASWAERAGAGFARACGVGFVRACGVGFVRACAVAAVTLLIPAVWAAAVALGVRWGAANPWSWLLPVVLVGGGTLPLARPVCRAVRFLVERWTGTVVPAGYRTAGPVTRMSTGYWWNGYTYERSRRDAVMDQSWRIRWSDPATWRDLRFTGIAPFTAGLVAALPPASVVWRCPGSRWRPREADGDRPRAGQGADAGGPGRGGELAGRTALNKP